MYLGISVLAECLDCPELKATADDFIHQHFTEVYKTDEFLQLDVKRVTHLLNQDTLTVRAEDQVTKLPSHIFLNKKCLYWFLITHVWTHDKGKSHIRKEYVLYTKQSIAILGACQADCLRNRSLHRDKTIGYHGRQNNAFPKDVHFPIPSIWNTPLWQIGLCICD